MAAVMTMTSLPVNIAEADMIPTETIIMSEYPSSGQSEVAKERIRTLLARSDIHAEMIALGVDPAEAARRVEALTDEELIQLAGHLDDLPAGKGAVTTFALVALFVTVVMLLATKSWSGAKSPCSYQYSCR